MNCYSIAFLGFRLGWVQVAIVRPIIKWYISVCELAYKPEARGENSAGQSIRIDYKKGRPVD